ncbi:MMPL family transporter [Mycolicibacterium sp.]|uniref:MMPL/RND family transporter n=1 Tax=Mycolicibacterium sp. TaxID=2320850 RepID=UPI001A3437B7|nr:MMPL family transporter [Mycolicibacterium sp.]MBJ7340664.1 MMPL family transporter [Mycolicibacterium sp.]
MSGPTHRAPDHEPTTDAIPTSGPAVNPTRHRLPKLIRTLALPVILGWIVIIAVMNIPQVTPQLEEVGKLRSVSMSPNDAPSVISMQHVGETFKEFKSNSSVMIVLEGQDKLGQESHDYYDELVRKLEADTKHVEHVNDMWSDPLTAAGSQSNDGKAMYFQVYLAGNMGEALANDSVEAVQKIVAGMTPPNGIKAYVTGPSALQADQHIASDNSMKLIESVTFVVIIVMLLLVYRSIVTVLLVLVMVVLELAAARGIVAFLGFHEIIGLSTFATNLLVTLAIAAATDYAIFLLGRYQEARSLGESKEDAYFTMFNGTAHVVLGSGLTIAGATFCLSFTRLPYFQTLGVPLAIGMVIVVVCALSLGPAVVTVASRFGLLEPKRALRTRGWRKIGALVVRWPGPILVATIALSLVGLLTLPGYKTDYNDRHYLPTDLPANEGYAAADRHFSQARMNPELMMIESDHDLRNSADFLVIDKIAKAVFRTPGIGRVQSITRPLGTPIEHTSIPFQISMQGTTQQMNLKYQQDSFASMLKQADEMQGMIENLEHMLVLMKQLNDVTHDLTLKTKDMVATTNELRDNIANFDDFFRPIRAYLYWEPHCYDIPLCWATRSVFDTLDGIDALSDQLGGLVTNLDALDRLMPQLMESLPPMLATMKSMKVMMLTMYQTQKGMSDQMAAMQENSTAMGEAFDASKNDDSFYLPPEIFDNAEFKKGMKNFISPDGHSVRFIISHEGDPMSAEGIAHIDAIKQAAKEAIKGTPLEGSKIYLAGTAATFKDMSDANVFDLIIAGIASLALIFIIMLLITRAVVASAVIVGTVVLSLGASFGLSVLIWQHILATPLHWMVMAMSVIILLAVGADYNLLLVSRFKEEIHAGINTGIIRSMGGTGSVVTSAGLVFAFTMMSMAVSSLTVIGQVGTTIGLGLLFDTLVVRSFMTPAIAAMLGKWFWWPTHVRQRPKPEAWPSPAKDSEPAPTV